MLNRFLVHAGVDAFAQSTGSTLISVGFVDQAGVTVKPFVYFAPVLLVVTNRTL